MNCIELSGRRAALAGKPWTDNPYSRSATTLGRFYWARGHKLGREERAASCECCLVDDGMFMSIASQLIITPLREPLSMPPCLVRNSCDLTGLHAGEPLELGDPVYIDGSRVFRIKPRKFRT